MRATWPLRHRALARLTAGALSALLALSSAAVIASAANSKSFTAAMTSGASLARGGTYLTGTQYASLAITITNRSLPESGSINLGSANIVPPGNGVVVLNPSTGAPAVADDPTACFTLAGGAAAGASACYITGTTTINGMTTTGPVIGLRNLSLPSSTSVTVTYPARVECNATIGNATWGVAAKQSNDFSGQPGNDLSIEPPNGFPTSLVAGDCHLVFAAQPADAEKSKTITSVAYTPTGAGVAVRVATGASDGDGVLFGNPRTVTLSKETGPTGGVLGGTISASTDGSGVATFAPPLAPTLDVSGTYTLRAADGSDVLDAVSAQFVIVDVAVPCKDSGPCSSGPQSADRSSVEVSTTNSNAGFATVSVNPPGTEDLCGSGSSGSDVLTGSDVFDINITESTATKTVRITIFKSSVTKAANKYQVCVRLDGTDTILPNCTSPTGPAPCVVSPSTVKGSVEIVFILDPGDPPSRVY